MVTTVHQFYSTPITVKIQDKYDDYDLREENKYKYSKRKQKSKRLVNEKKTNGSW